MFVYNKKTVDVKRVVNVAANNQSVSEILDRAFEGTGIHYVMEGNILCIPYPVSYGQEEFSIAYWMCIKEGGKLGDIYGNAFVCNGDGSIQVNADGSPVNKTGNKDLPEL